MTALFFFVPFRFFSSAREGTHLVPFGEDDSSFTVARQGPGDSAILQLLCTDLACEGAIGLIENVLGGHFDALAKGLSSGQEVKSWWSDYDLYGTSFVSAMIVFGRKVCMEEFLTIEAIRKDVVDGFTYRSWDLIWRH